MSTRLTITLSLEELECIQDQCRQLAESAKVAASVFTLDEMQAIREQYEAQLRIEAARCEDLEWRLEVALEQLHAGDPVDDIEDRPFIAKVQSTPPRGVRITTPREPRPLPPPLPVRARLGSENTRGSDVPNLPPPINLAPLRDALLRVACRREDRASA
jgi:hypothetical protein